MLTHVHNDHAGGTKHVKETLGLPMWVGAGDAEALRTGKAIPPPSFPAARCSRRRPARRRVEPDRELREGDELGHGFTVLETPGHSPGHLSFWRESDGTLICGDVFFGMNVFTGIYGLRQPPGIFTYDPPLNRRSERRLAELKPKLVLFGHGPPLREPAKLKDFVAALPDELGARVRARCRPTRSGRRPAARACRGACSDPRWPAPSHCFRRSTAGRLDRAARPRRAVA